jgi:hypothetical protein
MPDEVMLTFCRSVIGSRLGGPDKQDPPNEPCFAGDARNAGV